MTGQNLSSIIATTRRQLIDGEQLALPLSNMKKAAETLGDKSIVDEVEKAQSRYFYLLRFVAANQTSFSANTDASALRDSLLFTLAKIETLDAELNGTGARTAQLRFQRLRPEENLESLISDFLSELERLRTDPAALTDNRQRSRLERIASDIFKRMWASDPYTDDEVRLISTIISDTSIPAHYRRLMVNAIGLGTRGRLSEPRRTLLVNALSSEDAAIAITAQLWLILAHGASDKQLISSLPNIADIFHALARTLVKETDTDLPSMMELGQKLQGKNPMENPDLSPEDYELIKRFNEAQAKGHDMFAGTLGRMRSFPFFSDISNWFLSFHSDNSALAEIMDGEGAALGEMIEKMPVLTDSDKYALVLSATSIPASMRAEMLKGMIDNLHSLWNSEDFHRAVNESKPDDALTAALIVTGLDRFLTYHPEGRSQKQFNIHAILKALQPTLPADMDFAEEITAIIEYHRKEYYRSAIELFNLLPEALRVDPALLCVVADSFCKLGITDTATAIYRRVLTADPSAVEARLGLARINMLSGNETLNVELLEAIASSDTDNNDILSLLGRAYLAAGNIEAATSVFYNLDYVSNSNEAKEQLAWALTLSRDFDTAEMFYADSEHTSVDYDVHYGILLWQTGRRNSALDMLAKAKKEFSTFPEVFATASAQTLSVDKKSDIKLIPDILLYRESGANI